MKIELRGISKHYKRVRALDKVSLDIAPGQIIALLGANGAGKTSLLRCLSTVAGVDKGEIYCDEQLLRRDRLDLRKRLMFLPDFPFLFWDETVLRNIAIALRLYEAEHPGIEERIIDLLREFDLLALARTSVQTLSRGQAYKAGLTSMLAVNPEVWLLDEPFASGMDPHGINLFKQQARAAANDGRTIIYSTQILDVAERFSDKICVIHQGEVRAFDRFETLRDRAADKENVLEELFRQLRQEKS
ncbi:MAG: ABC transporter ATP-binding protein [Verrucomicrobia bacterium]|nr:ABC transporter ATP-binding protein [Verrucomicrobiota bacterium]